MESPVNQLSIRLARLGLIALLAPALSACYIAPLGWGHHHRGHGGYQGGYHGQGDYRGDARDPRDRRDGPYRDGPYRRGR